MISPEDVSFVITPSNIVDGSAHTVGDGLEFYADNIIARSSIGCFATIMGFESIGFSNTLVRITAVYDTEDERRKRVIVRPILNVMRQN